MNKSFVLLFSIKTVKKLANGTVPIYLRITIDSTRTEIATKRYVIPEKWNHSAQKVIGNLTNNPFINYKIKIKEVERQVLTEEELEILLLKRYSNTRLETTRDIFIFCCYTGLAYMLMGDAQLNDFILVGGTALALQIGHRKSIDLDFFTENTFNENELSEYLVTSKADGRKR